MLQPIYYIMDAGAWSEQGQSTAIGLVTLRVNPFNQQALQRCYQKLQYVNAGFSFCLCFAESQTFDEECINNIIAFFFFPHYYQASYAPVLIIEKGDQKGMETFSAALMEGAAKQGFKKVKLVRKSLDENNDMEYHISNKERLALDYLQALKSPIEKSFYIAVSESAEIGEIEQMLQRVEKDFAADSEAEYNMQKENKALQEKIKQLQYQLSLAEQEISHMASHMAVLRSTSQTSLLQNYYNNEYEVLPRWYKQLGHVLKVIQGKRTVQSLFDKKAKKNRS